MHEQRERLKGQICEARMNWVNSERSGDSPKQTEAKRRRIVALVADLQTLNGTGPASVEKPLPAVRLHALDMPLTVTLRGQGGWWTAICPELMVSGMGDDPHKAMEAVGRSIHSTLTVLVRKGHNGAGSAVRRGEAPSHPTAAAGSAPAGESNENLTS